MKPPVRFDDSLPIFAGLVKDTWAEAAVSDNLFLREASGRLTFIILVEIYPAQEIEALAARAAAELGAYVDSSGFAVATPDELFDESLRTREHAIRLRVDHPRFEGFVYLLDRRMVGADWLRNPAPAAKAPARFVFASLKGGVGRSTALCVLAAHLSATGRRVLAIDMDLEAPGLGNLLLPDGTLPEFGLLDYLVESEGGNPLDDQFFADMVGASWLGGGKGRVDVIPAIGQRSERFPANVLAKLARAYLAGSAPDFEVESFSDRMRALTERFADPNRYDAILIDARAGLHETTAAAVVGLGAEVLFFGMNQDQTFAGCRLLFAHLATLTHSPDDVWSNRFHVVQSKAPRDPKMRVHFAQRMESLLAEYLWLPQVSVDVDIAGLTETFDVDWVDENPEGLDAVISTELPPSILSIFDDDQFRFFDPLTDQQVLTEQAYRLTFGELLETAETIISALAERSEREGVE